MKLISIHFIMLVLLTACSQPIFDEAAAKKEVLAVLKSQEQGWNSGSIEEYMQGYVKSDSLRFASGGDITYGWQTTFQRYSGRYPDKATMGRVIFSDLDVTLLATDAAIVFGRWRLQREQDQPNGLFTLLLRKTKNGWRVVHDHTSSAAK